MEKEKKYKEIVDIEVKERISVDPKKPIDTFGDNDTGFEHNGYDGIVSDNVREMFANNEITADNKAQKLEILLCLCTLEDDSTKNIHFLSKKRKAHRSI